MLVQIILFIIGSGLPGFYIFKRLENKSVISVNEKSTWITMFTVIVSIFYLLIYIFYYYKVFEQKEFVFSHIQSFILSFICTFLLVVLVTEFLLPKIFEKFQDKTNENRSKNHLSVIEKPIYDLLFEETESLKYIELLDFSNSNILEKGYLINYQFENGKLLFNIEPKKNPIIIDEIKKDDIIKEIIHIDVENQIKFKLVKLKRH